MSNKICLVVSNCKNCWDTSSKLAFISECTPDYLDADEIKSKDHIILDGPYISLAKSNSLSTFFWRHILLQNALTP